MLTQDTVMHLIKGGTIFELSNGKEKEFISPFAQEKLEQDLKSHANNAWKYKEPDDASPGMVPRGMLWGGRGAGTKPQRPKATHVVRRGDRLYYVLEMTRSNGLFYYDLTRDEEIRLFHKEEFQPRGLFVAPDHTILTTTTTEEHTTHLVELDAQGRLSRQLTSGDCIDEQPFQQGRQVYYQSSGVARDAGGTFAAVGPSAINRLDLDSGEITTLLSSTEHDYLLPRVAPDGTLYCIQTPHHQAGQYPLKHLLLDVILFPWRMCVAVFAFLNAFSLFFAKKPLRTSGGPVTPDIDLSRRILHNRMVNLQQTMRRERKKVAVPSTWKLLRLSAGNTTVIASNVLWFEVDDVGGLVFTDGYGIYDAQGAQQQRFDDLICGFSPAPVAATAAKT